MGKLNFMKHFLDYMKHVNFSCNGKLTCLGLAALSMFLITNLAIARNAAQERANSETAWERINLSQAEIMLSNQMLENMLNDFNSLMYAKSSQQLDYAGSILLSLETADYNMKQDVHNLGQRLEYWEEFIGIVRRAVFLPPNGVRVDIDDLTVLSGASESQMNIILEGTGLHGAGWYFLEAERHHGVNAIIMAAIMHQESNLGSLGRLAQHNNFAGLVAHLSHPNEPIEGRWEQWGTRREGIFALAYRLGNFYLHPGQRFYSETYGPSIMGVNQRYALAPDGGPSPTWGEAVIRHALLFEGRIINNYNDSFRAVRYRNTGRNPYVDENGVMRSRG